MGTKNREKREIDYVRDQRKYRMMNLLGDIHGNFGLIKYYAMNDSVLIQVGDFGIGFNTRHEKHMLAEVNYKLREKNCFVYVIRGNHDDPEYFDNTSFMSNIFFVDDWTILELDVDDRQERVFCLGGALSIDRLRRTQGKDWWIEEKVVFDDLLVPSVKDITQVVTHTSPEWCEPYFLSSLVNDFAKDDPTLKDELFAERRGMSYAFDTIYDNNKETLRNHYYGHFHFSAVGEYKGVRTKLLNIGEICSNS